MIALDTETTGLDLYHGCRPFSPDRYSVSEIGSTSAKLLRERRPCRSAKLAGLAATVRVVPVVRLRLHLRGCVVSPQGRSGNQQLSGDSGPPGGSID